MIKILNSSEVVLTKKCERPLKNRPRRPVISAPTVYSIPGIEVGNVFLPAVVLTLGEVVQVGDLRLSRVVFGLGEVLQVGNLRLSRVVLRLGPVVQIGNLLLAGRVLRIELAVELSDVCDASLVKKGRQRQSKGRQLR